MLFHLTLYIQQIFLLVLFFGKFRVEKIYGGIQESISKKNIKSDLHFEKLHIVIAKLVAVLGILVRTRVWH